MASCATVLARTLRDLGITRMFGLPGGEILDFVEAARQAGIEFVLTRHEAAAGFMADVTGQITRRPGVCVSTLGPGAVNMTLGVANAYLDRSPMIAVTASLAKSAAPYATHQNLDLNAVYRPFTKRTLELDGRDTAAKVRSAYANSVTPRMGPVHIALPSDVARREESESAGPIEPAHTTDHQQPPAETLAHLVAEIQAAKRPIVILGLDVDPTAQTTAVRKFVEKLSAPCFVTPKAKGLIPEDHALFLGVCAGVAGDSVVVEFLERSDLLIGVGFDPVESDKLWHRTLKLVSLAPLTIAAGEFRPHLEAVGDLTRSLATLSDARYGPFDWAPSDFEGFRTALARELAPSTPPARGLSPFELTRALRNLLPRDTILVTDVGSIKSITSQAWTTFHERTFFESNGLSAMSYSLPGAMAARLAFPDRPVLCTIGDGGFGMTVSELETCVRRRIHFLTVVFNDDSLSLIRVSQENKGYPNYGVDYGPVDFAAVSAGFGAWSRRVDTMDGLVDAVEAARHVDRPAVIDVRIDPSEYRRHSLPIDSANSRRSG